MQSAWMWNLEHGPNGERDVSFWDYKLPFSTCSFKATSLLRLIFDKSTRFVSILTSTKINSEQLHIGSVAKKTWIASMFWLNWASYYYGRPDGLTFKKKWHGENTDSPHLMVPWNPLPLKNLIHPWPDANLYISRCRKRPETFRMKHSKLHGNENP